MSLTYADYLTNWEANGAAERTISKKVATQRSGSTPGESADL
jgi:hypothetical protein